MIPSTNTDHAIHRVAIVFAGGPAPAANAVISTAAASFLRNGIEVLGIQYGYSGLVKYAKDRPLVEGRDYRRIDGAVLRRTRNTRGILIGTARTNPGKDVSHTAHLADEKRVAPLQAVYDGLRSLGVDALISIGGDDTLKTANKLRLYQTRLPAAEVRIPIVHLPKTIDNDYMGIDFTFGYFTAVETLADEIGNLLADAESSRTYFLVETMGRSAGWLAYGAAIAGEASLVLSVEDLVNTHEETTEVTDKQTGKPVQVTRTVMDVQAVVRRMVATMRVREEAENKQFGVIVMAEGLAEYLPQKYLQNIPRDEYGHLSISQVNLGRLFAELVAAEYKGQTQRERKVKSLQLGYEARCARPHAFDVMLGSQLGVGAYRALVEEKLDGVMISVSGQLDLNYVPFEQLVDPETLATVVRYVEPGSDFHRLARFLETYVNEDWYLTKKH